MKVPYSWLKDFVNLDGITPEYLADKLVKAGFEVEEIIPLNDSYRNIVVGRICSIQPHPNATKLLICDIDVGTDHRQIVTGAHNIKEGDFVPVCLHGARLPDGKEIFSGELRGVRSDGMLCGGSELGLDDSDYPGAGFDGIFILDDRCPVGTDINVYIDTLDTILDVSVTANRPDTNSILGIAREVAAVLDRPLQMPVRADWQEQGAIEELITVHIDDTELCPRYMLKGLTNLKIQPSPDLIRRRLRKVGIRPINNVVDATNYVLTEIGQPMHAFDYAKIGGQTIVVRRANEGEHLVTLDGKDSALTSDNLVICDANAPMGLAGIMGGLDSGVHADTQTILLESARFKRDNIRRSSKALGIRSDSSARFEKGIDFLSQELAIERCCSLLVEQGCADVIGGVVDCFDGEIKNTVLSVPVAKINSILGISIPGDQMVSLLNRLELKTTVEEETLLVEIPAFREDIVGANDLAEEIIRLYGYDGLVSTPLDGMNQTHGGRTLHATWRSRIKAVLSGACGYSEMISYSFISPRYWDVMRLPADDVRRNTINLLNPLGEELSVMRTTLFPSMMRIASGNLSKGNKSFSLYEVGKIYLPHAELPSEEVEMLMMSCAGAEKDFYSLKAALDLVATRLHLSFRYTASAHPFLHPGRQANVMLGDICLGYIGEVHPTCAAECKISDRIQVAEINLEVLVENARAFVPYVPVPKYPAIMRDLAFVVERKITGDEILAQCRASAGALLAECHIFDVYEGAGIPDGHKSVAISLSFRDLQRTLSDAEVNPAIDKIIAEMQTTLGGVLR